MAVAVHLIEALTLLTILGVIMMTTTVVVLAVRVFRFLLVIAKVHNKQLQPHIKFFFINFCLLFILATRNDNQLYFWYT